MILCIYVKIITQLWLIVDISKHEHISDVQLPWYMELSLSSVVEYLFEWHTHTFYLQSILSLDLKHICHKNSELTAKGYYTSQILKDLERLQAAKCRVSVWILYCYISSHLCKSFEVWIYQINNKMYFYLQKLF